MLHLVHVAVSRVVEVGVGAVVEMARVVPDPSHDKNDHCKIPKIIF